MDTRDTRLCGHPADALRAAISGASDEYVAATIASAGTYQDSNAASERQESIRLSIVAHGTYVDLVNAFAGHVATGADPVAYLAERSAAARSASHLDLVEAADRARARLESALAVRRAAATKTIDDVIADLGSLADDISCSQREYSRGDAAAIDAAIKVLRDRARELDAWRRKAQAHLHLGLSAQEAARHAADATLRALGADPNVSLEANAEFEEDAKQSAVLAL